MALNIKKLSYALGASIEGLDLREPLRDDTLTQLKAAWLEHQVLVLRGQDITPEQQIAFTARFGEIEPYPLPDYQLPGYPEIFYVNQQPLVPGKKSAVPSRNWHSDLSFTDRPATGSILRSVKLPDLGGTTAFANQYMAWERLSPQFQKFIEGLKAIHAIFQKTGNVRDLDQGHVQDLKKSNPKVAHPLVRVHAETGRKALFLSETLTTEIVGMSQAESDAILAYLFRHQTRMEYTYRHTWKLHDMVMWDNRCVLHMAVADNPFTQPRELHRTTLRGERCGEILEHA